MQSKTLTKTVLFPLYMIILIMGFSVQSKAYINNTHSCAPDEEAITLSNTLDEIAYINIKIGGKRNIVLSSIKKKVAPGGMQTICIPSNKKPRWIHACLDSFHGEEEQLFYTFDPEHEAHEPLAFIIAADEEFYPPIL